MSSENPQPNAPAPRRASRWSPPASSPASPYRSIFRFLGIPLIAVAGVILYRGLQAHFVLPACDSENAKQTLSKVLKELNLEPVRYAPIKTVSSSKEKVVCNAVMPLPDGANVVADYTFYWDGSKVSMRYSVSRQAKGSSLGPAELASDLLFDVQ